MLLSFSHMTQQPDKTSFHAVVPRHNTLMMLGDTHSVELALWESHGRIEIRIAAGEVRTLVVLDSPAGVKTSQLFEAMDNQEAMGFINYDPALGNDTYHMTLSESDVDTILNSVPTHDASDDVAHNAGPSAVMTTLFGFFPKAPAVIFGPHGVTAGECAEYSYGESALENLFVNAHRVLEAEKVANQLPTASFGSEIADRLYSDVALTGLPSKSTLNALFPRVSDNKMARMMSVWANRVGYDTSGTAGVRGANQNRRPLVLSSEMRMITAEGLEQCFQKFGATDAVVKRLADHFAWSPFTYATAPYLILEELAGVEKAETLVMDAVEFANDQANNPVVATLGHARHSLYASTLALANYLDFKGAGTELSASSRGLLEADFINALEVSLNVAGDVTLAGM